MKITKTQLFNIINNKIPTDLAEEYISVLKPITDDDGYVDMESPKYVSIVDDFLTRHNCNHKYNYVSDVLFVVRFAVLIA